MIIDEVNQDASNVPISEVINPTLINVSNSLGASRYRYKWNEGELHTLLLNKDSDTLVVSFHGAVDRTSTKLPRFERVKTLKDTEHSSLFIGDPTLYSDESLSLAWFTGWHSIDLQRLIARWLVQIAQQLNIKHLILSGSSGGGFAAMQISSFIPNSVALAFNAQTDIKSYRINGHSLGAQQTYLRCTRPDIWERLSPEEKREVDIDWESHFDDRVSVLNRYKYPMDNYLLLVENDEEFHYEDHYLPLVEVLKSHQEIGRYRCATYSGGKIHNPPTLAIFNEYLTKAVAWAKELPPVGRTISHKPGALSWFDLMANRVDHQDNTFDLRLNDKTYFSQFAKEHNIPVAETLGVYDLNDPKLTLPKNSSIVIKPSNSSSSRGILILERTSNDTYKEIRTNDVMTTSDILSFYKDFFSKYPLDDKRILIQKKLFDRGQYPVPRDFKFYVFGGKVGLIQCLDRNRKPTGTTWFDEKFQHLPVDSIEINPKYQTRVGFARPDQSDELVELAEHVAQLIDTPFVRVDLYLTPNGPVCGEVTFTPGGPYYELTDKLSTRMQMQMGAAWQTNSPLRISTLEDVY